MYTSICFWNASNTKSTSKKNMYSKVPLSRFVWLNHWEADPGGQLGPFILRELKRVWAQGEFLGYRLLRHTKYVFIWLCSTWAAGNINRISSDSKKILSRFCGGIKTHDVLYAGQNRSESWTWACGICGHIFTKTAQCKNHQNFLINSRLPPSCND